MLDASPSGSGLIGWAHDLHGSLMLRDYSGRGIVGAVGIAMLISSLSGLYLWWPRGTYRISLTDPAGDTLAQTAVAFVDPDSGALVRRIDASTHRRSPLRTGSSRCNARCTKASRWVWPGAS